MNREQFRERLETIDSDDEEGFVAAIQQRVGALSGRHLDIQAEIQASDETRQSLAGRLEEIEDEIVAQADASVEQDVESLADVEALPADANVSFDPDLMREVEEIRALARTNYQQTVAQGEDLQVELNENTEELEEYGDVLARVEAGELSPQDARERLLTFLDENE